MCKPSPRNLTAGRGPCCIVALSLVVGHVSAVFSTQIQLNSLMSYFQTNSQANYYGHPALRMSGATSPYYCILFYKQFYLLACHLILLVNGKLILCSQAMAIALSRQCSRCLSSLVGLKNNFHCGCYQRERHTFSFYKFEQHRHSL